GAALLAPPSLLRQEAARQGLSEAQLRRRAAVQASLSARRSALEATQAEAARRGAESPGRLPSVQDRIRDLGDRLQAEGRPSFERRARVTRRSGVPTFGN
ncbi:MAG: hypothetical protein AAF677_11440, partial [Pseudomonadota bacterium]